MKHPLVYLLFLFSTINVCGQHPSSVRISGSVADSLDAEGRTAYLFTYFDNQAAFIDSCRICGGRFVLEGRIPFDEVAAEVLIERVPLSSGSIVVRSGDRIDFAFAPLGRMGRPEVSGSESQEELCSVLGAPVVTLRKRLQAESLNLSPDDDRRAALATRIDSCFRAEGLLWRVQCGICLPQSFAGSVGERTDRDIRIYPCKIPRQCESFDAYGNDSFR